MVTIFTGCPFAVYRIRPRSVIPVLDQRPTRGRACRIEDNARYGGMPGRRCDP